MNQIWSEVLEQEDRTVSAAGPIHGSEGPDRRRRGADSVKPSGNRSGKERGFLAQGIGTDSRSKPRLRATLPDRVQCVRLCITGRRNNRHRHAGRYRVWSRQTLHHASPIQISLAGGVSVISEPSPAQSTRCSPPGARTRRLKALPPRRAMSLQPSRRFLFRMMSSYLPRARSILIQSCLHPQYFTDSMFVSPGKINVSENLWSKILPCPAV